MWSTSASSRSSRGAQREKIPDRDKSSNRVVASKHTSEIEVRRKRHDFHVVTKERARMYVHFAVFVLENMRFRKKISNRFVPFLLCHSQDFYARMKKNQEKNTNQDSTERQKKEIVGEIMSDLRSNLEILKNTEWLYSERGNPSKFSSGGAVGPCGG